MTLDALKVRGPFRGPSGYEHHVREFVRALHGAGVEVELVDLPMWGPAKLPLHLRDPWFETLRRATGARTVLHFCMPHQVVAERGRANVNYTMFEASRIPAHWADLARHVDRVVLPTPSSRDAWTAGGVPADLIRLCSLGVDPALYSGPVAPLPLRTVDGEQVDQYAVRFLCVAELVPRKNLVGLLRVWLSVTTRSDDAVLILKLGCYQPGVREVFDRRLRRLEAELGRSLADAAPVHIVEHLFPDTEMPRLYAAASHYISLSFGEGWDQPMVEAAASGLKLIAPDHSAYTAYLDSTVAHLVPSREVPAVFDPEDGSGVLFEGASWWEPDQEEASRLVRAAIDRRDRATGSARERVLAELTWERATRRLVTLLEEAQAARGRRRRLVPWPRRSRRP